MTRVEQSLRSHRKHIALGGALALLLTAGTVIWSHSAEAGSVGPDVTVIYLGSTVNWGSSGGQRGYSVGTVSCNVGDEPLWWCDENRAYCNDDQHPVIAQNLYRLKQGRFEQVGMSWLKHGFLSLNTSDPACGSCQTPPHGGDQLGIGCTDAYGASLNGSRPLGLRSEVNATTGQYPFPATQVTTSQVVDQRMIVEESDLDPTLNPGALYWIEGHYISPDDAESKNGLNNASYRAVNVTGANFSLSPQGGTVRERSALHAWRAADPFVEMADADLQSNPPQRFEVARKVVGTESWHYEYAIHNMNSDRSARSFSIQLPAGATIDNVGFRDVDHHSGEPYATTDWDITVDSAAGTLSWSTDDYNTDQFANALRWGTMFTFWFDSDAPPVGLEHTLGLFKPGLPGQVAFNFNSGIFADSFESGDTSAWSN